MTCSLRFIPPASPHRRDRPPVGERWAHEAKFDGYRIQPHKVGRDVDLLSKNGHHFTARFPAIAYVLRELPAKSAIIDAEIVASSGTGIPDFRKLHDSPATPDELCLWAFDLLHLNGKDLLDLPLAARRAKLQALIERHDCPTVLFSEGFADPHRLLAACEERHLEGIISKRVDAPYRSGSSTDWVKVKCNGWREANKERWRLFENKE
jgi:bifunctional non-homologous end joining protein LigD